MELLSRKFFSMVMMARNICFCSAFIITLTVLFNTYVNSIIVYSQDDSKTSKTNIQPLTNDTSTNTEDLTELDDSNITTKIYKSTDKFSRILDENLNTETAVEHDVITKDELIRQGNKKHKKDRYIKREKKQDEATQQPCLSIFLPWLSLILLAALLGAIFYFMKKKKI